jgi:hypothetical protein
LDWIKRGKISSAAEQCLRSEQGIAGSTTNSQRAAMPQKTSEIQAALLPEDDAGDCNHVIMIFLSLGL